ncbi:hypothetical protein M8J77_008244 [Diaphorina citri]|nr:hypothetical protein M8J77_008244 [Diaphorina citri]
MPQTVSNLPLQPSQSSGALWLKAMCDALWLTAMCDALWLTAMCDALWLTAMCDALWLTAMCDTLWLTTKGLISLHISSLATLPPRGEENQPRTMVCVALNRATKHWTRFNYVGQHLSTRLPRTSTM